MIKLVLRQAGRESTALDLERQGRTRHCPQSAQPGLVHLEPWNSQRNLLPCVDQACTRDFGLMVTVGAGLFSEEKRYDLPGPPVDREFRCSTS